MKKIEVNLKPKKKGLLKIYVFHGLTRFKGLFGVAAC